MLKIIVENAYFYIFDTIFTPGCRMMRDFDGSKHQEIGNEPDKCMVHILDLGL